MFNIGGGELLVILVVALVVLGPDKLPEAAREMGRFTRQMREMARGFQREFDAVKNELSETEARARGAALAAANPPPRGNLDTFEAESATPPQDDLDAPNEVAASEETDESTPSVDSEEAPNAPADPFANKVRPAFDAKAQPDRTVKPVSAAPGDATNGSDVQSVVESANESVAADRPEIS